MKFTRFIDPGGSQEPPAIAPGVAVRASMEKAMTKHIDLSGWEWDVNPDWTLRQACEAGAKVMLNEMQRDVHFSLEIKDNEPLVKMKDIETGVVFCEQPFSELFAGFLPVLLDDDWHEDYRENVVSVLAILNKYKEIFEAGLSKMDSRKGV